MIDLLVKYRPLIFYCCLLLGMVGVLFDWKLLGHAYADSHQWRIAWAAYAIGVFPYCFKKNKDAGVT